MQQIFQCPRCGAQNYQGQQVCWNCGMQFIQQQPGWQQPPMQQPNQQQYQQQYQQQTPPQQQYRQPVQPPGMHYQQQYGYNWQTPQKKSSSTGLVLLTVLIVVLFAVAAVGILSKGTFFIPSKSEPPTSTPVTEPGDTSEQPEEEEEETPEETIIQVDASSLIAEYMQDAESADAAYKGKQIEVTGLVEYIGVEGEEGQEIPYVYLGGHKQSELFLVKCYFTAEEKSVVDALEILGSTTIEGTCEGYADDIIVRDCSIQ